jgi:amino acid adenylation domain-containing protein
MTVKQTIHSTFSTLAARVPERVALVCGRDSMTYGALERRAAQVAAYLRRCGVVRGQRVGLYSQRSTDAIAAILGILKVGAAYVPFDPSYPEHLLGFIYEDCGPAVMLVQSSLLNAQHPPFWKGAHHDIAGAVEVDAPPDAQIGAECTVEDVAYVMYTSGSTGRPKGVLIPHRGVVRLVIDNTFADMGPEHVHLQMAPLAFDASTFEIWGALLHGGKLAILPSPYPSLDEIAESISHYGVTTLWLTAGLFHLMVDHRLQGLSPLRQLLAGGDVLSPTHVARAQAALPHCQIINGYGPTENTTFTCCYRIPREPGAPSGAPLPGGGPPPAIPIGTPIAHTEVYLLDEQRQRVPEGQAGELYAGGEGVGLGYLNRDELTAERFIPNPFDPHGRTKLYRTGDRVRRRPDGNIEFLGRVDRQVKINGKRVELDEIEAILRRCPLVEDAAAIAPATDGAGPRRVHAYVKLKTGHAGSPLPELRAFMKEESPDYMMPATFTLMDALPLSPTGKIDRSKLPAPPTSAAAAAPQASPSTDLEHALLQIWRNVLGSGAVGVDDNFFDLGGTSLQLIQVHATIVSTMQRDVSVVDLFQYPRISALAARLAGAPAGAAASVARTPAGSDLSADERARRQQAALIRARGNPRRNVR